MAAGKKGWMLPYREEIHTSRGATYVVGDCLGRGGFGEVYKCGRADNAGQYGQQTVAALKVQYSPNGWLREVSAMKELQKKVNNTTSSFTKKLGSFFGLSASGERAEEEEVEDDHHIVKMLDHFQHRGLHYMVMELMPTDLWLHLRKQPQMRFTALQVSTVARQLLTALGWLKEKGVIHADIKLSNILINPRDWTVKLTDFGLALFKQSASNYRGKNQLQSFPNRAPEIYLGADVTMASDVYALGAMCGTMYFGLKCPIFAPSVPLEDMFAMHLMVHLFGQVPDEMLRGALFADQYYDFDTQKKRYSLKEKSTTGREARAMQRECSIRDPRDIKDASFAEFLWSCCQMNLRNACCQKMP